VEPAGDFLPGGSGDVSAAAAGGIRSLTVTAR
jgi:hypothetical protein